MDEWVGSKRGDHAPSTLTGNPVPLISQFLSMKLQIHIHVFKILLFYSCAIVDGDSPLVQNIVRSSQNGYHQVRKKENESLKFEKSF